MSAGHNNPPADAAMGLHIDDLFQMLSDSLPAGPVANDEQEAAIDLLMDDFRKASKDAENARKAEKEPHLEAGRAVDAKWKPITTKATRGVDACKEALTPYRAAKQQAKDAAAAKAREEAAEMERQAQEAFRQSDDLEARFQAEQQLEQAQKLTAIANKIDRSATGLRTTYAHKIISRQELLRFVKDKFPEDLADMLNEWARKKVATGARYIPGCEIKEIRKAA